MPLLKSEGATPIIGSRWWRVLTILVYCCAEFCRLGFNPTVLFDSKRVVGLKPDLQKQGK
jgi:hypothetical protein